MGSEMCIRDRSGADRPDIVARFLVDDRGSGNSSSISCSDGLADLLGGGPRTTGLSVEMRTQFDRLCRPFLISTELLEVGLPFSAEGLLVCGEEAHWNRLLLMLSFDN